MLWNQPHTTPQRTVEQWHAVLRATATTTTTRTRWFDRGERVGITIAKILTP